MSQDVFNGTPGGNERRRVYYEGFKQALTLAKRLGEGGSPAKIQIFWSCGGKVNQCWVSWAGPPGRAVVTMILLSDVAATGVPDAEAMEAQPVASPADEAAGLYIVRGDDTGSAKMFKAKPVIGV